MSQLPTVDPRDHPLLWIDEVVSEEAKKLSSIYWMGDVTLQMPRANAIITNIQDPEDKKKQKRPSRAQLSKGRPLSFYEVVEMIRTRYDNFRTHPSRAMVYWGRPMSIFHVASRNFATVMEGAMTGLICEAVYPPGYQCRCDDCCKQKVKKPRGPKRQANGSIFIDHFRKYRGALSFGEMQDLKPLVVEADGKPSYPPDIFNVREIK
jgi:hypothetical protein